jgi:DNA replication protein DnaC
MSTTTTIPKSLAVHLRALKLPAFVDHHAEVATRAEEQGWTLGQSLHYLCELEHAGRRRRRIERLLRASRLPAEKTMATLELSRLPPKVRRQVPSLCEGGFVERAENVLAFGLPGRGKTHLLSAIGHELVQHGHSVFFTPTYRLVQQLLVAKRDLALEEELQRLDGFDAVILDDLGYVQQDREEMEVLFTFLAQRYERRSVMITSNLVFSQWDQIFKNPMTTAAAIDRIVHHAIILELDGPSIRNEAAKARNKASLEAAPEQ